MKKEKVFVITGGAGGMGIATAKKLKSKGILLLVDLLADRLEQVKFELQNQGANVETFICDVANKDQVQKLVKRTSELGALGAIIHTAGLSKHMGNAVRIMEVNMVGTVHILDSFINIAEKDTVAVCLASMSGHIAPVEEKIDKLLDNPLDNNFLNNMEKITKDDTLFSYRIAKRGVLRLVEHRVQEWANKGARIVSISPGLVKTPQGKQVLDEEPEVGIYMVDNNPLKRIGEPDEIAGLIEFLCSEKASYITGTDIRIDGGVTPVLQGK